MNVNRTKFRSHMPLFICVLATTTAFMPQSTQPPLGTLRKIRGGATEHHMSSLGAVAASAGAAYSMALVAKPLLTKAVTSAAIFGLSDTAAQALAPPAAGWDGKRTVVTMLIGLVYFGPALHYYLEFITWLIPGDGIRQTLLKTLAGQLGFGPAITCIFFGAFLIADNGLAEGLEKWPAKIRQDLLVTWASELCFWPFVDLVCYSFIPVMWIPLGYNAANFFWTIFLALQASRPVASNEESIS